MLQFACNIKISLTHDVRDPLQSLLQRFNVLTLTKIPVLWIGIVGCRSDPDFHVDADPHAHPIPSFTLVKKIRIFFFWSQLC
jgi:hypothetical protein